MIEAPPAPDSRPPGRSSKAREFRRSWRVVVAAMLGLGFGGGSSLYWFGVMVGPLSREFGWSNSAISGWPLVLNICQHFFAPLTGRLVDRYGARIVAIWSIPMVGLGFAGAGLFMHALWELYLAAFLIGVAGSATAAYTRTLSSWFDAGRGTALGVALSGIGITSTLLPRITQAVDDAMGWRVGFVFLGVMTLSPLLPAFFWLHERREVSNRASAPAESGYGPLQALRLPAFWLFGSAGLLYFLGYNGVGFGLIPFLTEKGITRANAAYYAAVLGSFGFLGKIITGALFDRLRAPFVLACLLVADTVAIVILVPFARNEAIVALAIVGLGQGGIIVSLPYLVARYFGLKSFGSISGLTNILFGFSSFGPLLFSILRDHSGSYSLSLMVSSALVLGASTLFALLGLQPYLSQAARAAKPA